MADQIAQRIRATMPPQLLDPTKMSPEEQQAAAAKMQQGAQQAQFQAQMAMAQYQKLQSEIAVNASRAQNYQAQAESIPQREQTQAMSAASQAADRELRGKLEAIKTATGS